MDDQKTHVMKSQDILLLLKLIALSKQEPHSLEPSALSPCEDWTDWDVAEDVEDEISLPPNKSKVEQGDLYSVRSLSLLTGISKSEIANALARCYQCGLAKQSRNTAKPSVNTRGLGEFLVYGIRYVFPVKMQSFARGIATGMTAPVFGGVLKSLGDQTPVWPDPKGNTSGLAVEPLFKSVPMAVRKDPQLYILLALVDSIRLGLPRERTLAIEMLEKILKD